MVKFGLIDSIKNQANVQVADMILPSFAQILGEMKLFDMYIL